ADLAGRLAGDERLPLGADRLAELLGDPLALVGDAPRQVRSFLGQVAAIAAADPTAAAYTPEPIL
ncbi:MAG: adenylosuccinate lyase, partial [Actinomycetota bacterium]|nr:adenylosuccinate lyase [Actinomycetota bacterium]